MRNVQLSEGARNLLEKRGSEAFRKRCGEEFVIGWITGGEFHAIIQIDTHSGQEKQEISAGIGGSVGVFSGSAEFTKALSQVSANNRVQVYVYRSGGAGREIPTEPAEMIRAAANFPDAVRGQGGFPIVALMQNYDALDLPDTATPIDTMAQRNVLDELARLESDFSLSSSNIEYVLSNQSQFINVQVSALNDAAGTIRENLNTIREAARVCYKDYRICKLPEKTALRYPAITLPERVETTAEACKEPLYYKRKDVACGVASYASGEGEVCGVLKYRVGRGEVCGVSSYKERRSKACGIESYRYAKSSSCGEEYWEFEHYINSDDAAYKHRYFTKLCQEQGWDNYKPTKYPRCARDKSCRHRSNGVDRYKSCRSSAHGVQNFSQCRNEKFGVERFRTCSNQVFGVAEYKSCRKSVFGLEKCLRF